MELTDSLRQHHASNSSTTLTLSDLYTILETKSGTGEHHRHGVRRQHSGRYRTVFDPSTRPFLSVNARRQRPIPARERSDAGDPLVAAHYLARKLRMPRHPFGLDLSAVCRKQPAVLTDPWTQTSRIRPT